MTNNFANIYDYVNYRDFISDYQKARFKHDEGFSRSKICQKLGLPNTRSYFRNVLAGKDITKTFVERFVKAFELNRQEAKYFRVLVQFTQSQSEEEREELFLQLIALNQTPKRFISTDMYAYYSSTRHSVIRSALDVFTVKEDYKELGRLLIPAVSESKTKSSFGLLERLGMIHKDAHGVWRQTQKNVSAGDCGKNEVVKQYQLGKIEQGKKALLSGNNAPTHTLTMTLSLSANLLKKVEKKVERFRAELRSMVHKDEHPADQVYQLNLQYFPQTKKKRKTNDSHE